MIWSQLASLVKPLMGPVRRHTSRNARSRAFVSFFSVKTIYTRNGTLPIDTYTESASKCTCLPIYSPAALWASGCAYLGLEESHTTRAESTQALIAREVQECGAEALGWTGSLAAGGTWTPASSRPGSRLRSPGWSVPPMG